MLDLRILPSKKCVSRTGSANQFDSRSGQVLLVTGSVDRHQLYAMQTPQIFERALIEEAYRAIYADNVSVTDEVSAVERLGREVALVLNDDFNFKIYSSAKRCKRVTRWKRRTRSIVGSSCWICAYCRAKNACREPAVPINSLAGKEQ